MAETKQEKLGKALIELLGSNNVYFQPPESIKMNYPCIVYKRSTGKTQYANNMPYEYDQKYSVTYIDKEPDSGMVEKIAMAFPKCYYDRSFVYENLNHDVFSIYY